MEKRGKPVRKEFSKLYWSSNYSLLRLGKGPKIKKRENMVFDHRGGEGVTQNQILIQTSFYSGNFAIFSANIRNSE